jgi:hypothetical protein
MLHINGTSTNYVPGFNAHQDPDERRKKIDSSHAEI